MFGNQLMCLIVEIYMIDHERLQFSRFTFIFIIILLFNVRMYINIGVICVVVMVIYIVTINGGKVRAIKESTTNNQMITFHIKCIYLIVFISFVYVCQIL